MPSLSWGPCSKRVVPPSLAQSDISLPQLTHLLDFQNSIASRFGGFHEVFSAFKYFSAQWQPKQIITILNLQCGDGELARRVMQWSKKRELDVRIVATDPDHRLIQIAKDHKGKHSNIHYETKDFTDHSFLQAQQVDYVISGFSLHQYNEANSIAFLKKVNLLAKRGYVILDGVRDIRRWGLFKTQLGFQSSDVVRQLALQSVQHSFSSREIRILLAGARLELARATFPWGFWSVIQSERAMVGAADVSVVPTFLGA